MKNLPILWQRLVNPRGSTCPRCLATGGEVERAVERLTRVLEPLGVRPVLETREVGEAAFAEDPSLSNRIWIDGVPVEDWLQGRAGSSRCCNECGDRDCRTLELGGATYEVVPEDLIVQAGFIAGTRLVDASRPRSPDPAGAGARGSCGSGCGCR